MSYLVTDLLCDFSNNLSLSHVRDAAVGLHSIKIHCLSDIDIH